VTTFKINTALLKATLESSLPAVPAKPSRDILKCFKFVTTQGPKGEIEIFATDLERYLAVKIPREIPDGTGAKKSAYEVTLEGSFAVPAAIFLDYIKAIDEAFVDIVLTTESTLQVIAGTSIFQVGVMDIEDFPDFPKLPDTLSWIDVEAASLASCLQRVLFAVAEKGHPKWGGLSSVCFELSGDKLSLIGTDQRRASVATIPLNKKVPEAKELLVAAPTLKAITKIFDGTISLSLDNPNSMIFRSGFTTLFVRLVSGAFPPVKNFIPSNYSDKLLIDAKSFLREVKRVALATDALLEMELRKDKVILKAKTKEDKKEAKVEYAWVSTASDIDLAIDAEYLIDVLEVCDSKIEMCYATCTKPLLFKSEGFEHLIVPKEPKKRG